jgi:hypothetical protein
LIQCQLLLLSERYTTKRLIPQRIQLFLKPEIKPMGRSKYGKKIQTDTCNMSTAHMPMSNIHLMD